MDTECYTFSFDLSFNVTDGSSKKEMLCAGMFHEQHWDFHVYLSENKYCTILNGVKIIKKRDWKVCFLSLILHVILLCSLDWCLLILLYSRCQKWLERISLSEDIDTLHNKIFVCRKHFSAEQFSGVRTLNKTAVPNLFLVSADIGYY